MGSDVKPDWRIIKVDQTRVCGETWIKEKKIVSCGVYYLVDVNLHVHICSLTPSFEAWPMYSYATFETEEASKADEGLAEQELLESEELVSYFDTKIERFPSRSATDYVDIILEREEDEKRDQYNMRVADCAREYFCGNPVCF